MLCLRGQRERGEAGLRSPVCFDPSALSLQLNTWGWAVELRARAYLPHLCSGNSVLNRG